MIQLESTYQPKNYERKIWKFWVDNNLFASKVDKSKKPYSILMPPPNVTSQLHMGHGLGYSIQDLLIRWKRMSGFNAMWLPGTDHAGIATQMMVEKALEAENLNRKSLGREAFVQRCQDWKDKYGGIILDQFAHMGFSCDWSRVAYTMDPQLSKAVRWVFVDLFNKGLIYRGERLVNWDTNLQTALSDDELESVEIQGHLWTFKYPVENSSEHISIATTRPETMFGDTAVAVNPNDTNLNHLIGKRVKLPFTDRTIPIIADDYVKTEFGTGAVKITPAHDHNDFAVGKRHNLPMISIFNDDGTTNNNVPMKYRGFDRFAVRKQVIKDLKELGLFEKETAYNHAVPHSERSKSIIEPKLSLQWYVKASTMAAMAAQEAREDRLKFFPDNWKKTYLYWLDNIQDWCISRQLWWGHRIPVWYCASTGCSPITSMEDPTQCPSCGSTQLKQDEDVLDTWFSSWLWPLSPFGWPDSGKSELDYYYPTSTLVTAPEIIFLWVARMVMVGKEYLGEIPFHHVYFNATVCDKHGRKFSKTLGNGIDPLEVIEMHGADAVRFTAISLAPLGGRVRMSIEDFELGSKFINKLWNASRLILQNLNSHDALLPLESLNLDDSQKWLVHELRTTAALVNNLLENYKINEAVEKVYHFIWGDLCDWGLELAKHNLADSADPHIRKSCLSVLVYCLDGALRLAHPVIPFVTEELWQHLPHHPNWDRPVSLAIAMYPIADNLLAFAHEAEQWNLVKEVITRLRSVRSQAGIAPQTKLKVMINAQANSVDVIARSSDAIERLAKVEVIEVSPEVNRPSKSLVGVGSRFATYMQVEGHLNVEDEIKRLTTEENRLEKVLQGYSQKLNNPSFIAKAPQELVDETRAKSSGVETQLTEIRLNISALKS